MESPLRILIVDDDTVCQIVLRTILERLGHQATTADNGLEALSIFEKQHFDLAFIDLYMPGITGDETAKHMKQLSRNRDKNIKIIITTAHDSYGIDSLQKSWIDGILNKPLCRESIQHSLTF